MRDTRVIKTYDTHALLKKDLARANFLILYKEIHLYLPKVRNYIRMKVDFKVKRRTDVEEEHFIVKFPVQQESYIDVHLVTKLQETRNKKNGQTYKKK